MWAHLHWYCRDIFIIQWYSFREKINKSPNIELCWRRAKSDMMYLYFSGIMLIFTWIGTHSHLMRHWRRSFVVLYNKFLFHAISFTTQWKAANAFATIFAVIKIKPNYWVAFIISGTQKYIKVKPAWSIIENKNQTIFFRIKEENQNYCNCALSIHVTCILLLQHLEEHIFILHYLVH